MKYEKIYLSKISKKFAGKDSFLECYTTKNIESVELVKRPAMLIIPGGGYNYCSDREGEPIAMRFLSEGFNCFVLNYTCNVSYPLPHQEVAVAIDYINKHLKKYDLLDSGVTLIGFSAGGHLASSYSYLYKNIEKEMKVEKNSLKPNALILGYPVITTKEFCHQGSVDTITGKNKNLLKLLSVEDHITKSYPSTYIFTTKEDIVVPVKNFDVFVKELRKNKVKVQYRLYEHGSHGGSLYNYSVYSRNTDLSKVKENQNWVLEAKDFIFNLLKKNA